MNGKKDRIEKKNLMKQMTKYYSWQNKIHFNFVYHSDGKSKMTETDDNKLHIKI